MKVLCIEIHPSFKQGETYRILPSYDERNKFVGYCLNFRRPKPGADKDAIIKGKVFVSEERFEKILSKCKALKINVIPEKYTIGLDGTGTEIYIEIGDIRIELKWWEDVPEQWKPIEQIIEMVRDIARHPEKQPNMSSLH